MIHHGIRVSGRFGLTRASAAVRDLTALSGIPPASDQKQNVSIMHAP